MNARKETKLPGSNPANALHGLSETLTLLTLLTPEAPGQAPGQAPRELRASSPRTRQGRAEVCSGTRARFHGVPGSDLADWRKTAPLALATASALSSKILAATDLEAGMHRRQHHRATPAAARAASLVTATSMAHQTCPRSPTRRMASARRATMSSRRAAVRACCGADAGVGQALFACAIRAAAWGTFFTATASSITAPSSQGPLRAVSISRPRAASIAWRAQ
mmetsp:Transcript_583/g.1342  ORF Transcript_583/g.1342 Transcript_583/m.1342 type:complete len:223 (-) Transcript_583:86-754(-)